MTRSVVAGVVAGLVLLGAGRCGNHYPPVDFDDPDATPVQTDGDDPAEPTPLPDGRDPTPTPALDDGR